MEFNNFGEAIRHFAARFGEKDAHERDAAGTGDDYKREIVELNNQSYQVPMTEIVVDGKTHKAYPFWVVGEILTEMFGMNPPLMTRYNSEVIEWSYKLKHDRRVEYCYGERWAEHNQLINLITTLRERPDSKRAVLATYMPYDTDTKRKDVPCTVFHQFLIRDGRMNTTTFFRSHDFFSGMKYDVYLSSFLGQFIAMGVNAGGNNDVQPGDLHFFDGSLHVYGKDVPRLPEVQAVTQAERLFDIMHQYATVDQLFQDMVELKEAEEASYWGKFDAAQSKLTKIVNPAFRDFARVYINRNAKYNNADIKLPYETKSLGW